jgi:hypothetical protein
MFRKGSEMLKRLIYAFVLASLSAGSMQFAVAETPDDVLSKADATRVFSQSFNSWRTNALLVQSTGAGTAQIASEYEITLFVKAPGGILAVTPSYKKFSEDKPWRITVSVMQDEAGSFITRTVSDSGLKAIMAEIQGQMLPEFTVLSKVDLTAKNVQYDYFIFEVGVFPLLDELAVLSKGCWKQCITR